MVWSSINTGDVILTSQFLLCTHALIAWLWRVNARMGNMGKGSYANYRQCKEVNAILTLQQIERWLISHHAFLDLSSWFLLGIINLSIYNERSRPTVQPIFGISTWVDKFIVSVSNFFLHFRAPFASAVVESTRCDLYHCGDSVSPRTYDYNTIILRAYIQKPIYPFI